MRTSPARDVARPQSISCDLEHIDRLMRSPAHTHLCDSHPAIGDGHTLGAGEETRQCRGHRLYASSASALEQLDDDPLLGFGFDRTAPTASRRREREVEGR
jgi:hypothetical protein